MKKLVFIALAVLNVLALNSCGKENNDGSDNEGKSNNTNNQTNNNEEQPTIPSNYYVLSPDGKTLMQWFNTEAKFIDMQADKVLRNVTKFSASLAECNKLVSIILPNNLLILGEGTLGDCSSLASVSFSNNLTTIERKAFEYSKALSSVSLPKSLIYIGDEAFIGCESLKSITIQAVKPPTIRYRVFDERYIQHIYVPAISVETYKKTEGWILYAAKIQAIP